MPLISKVREKIITTDNLVLKVSQWKKNKMKVKKTVTQNEFLRKLGIIERAEILGKKMKFSDQTNLYLRLKRLLSPKSMGNLFKVLEINI